MKLFIFIMLLSSVSFGSTDHDHLYFQYQYEDKVFLYESEDLNWEKNMELGADKCMEFFKASPDNEQRFLELVDICANPR